MDSHEKAILSEHLRAEAAHDAEAAAACYVSDGWYLHEALDLRFDGRDEIQGQYALSYEAFPDLVFAVEEEIEGDHSMVQRGRFQGTFAAALLGLEPTRRYVDVPMTTFYDFQDGLILSERIVMDIAVFAEQTGLDLTELQQTLGFDSAAGRAWAAVTRYAEAKSRADIDAALAECTDDFELCTVPFGITSHGSAESRAGLALWRGIPWFPHVTVDGHLTSGRSVTCWGTIAATMHGDLGPLPGTGRSYRLPFSCIFDIEDGHIRREEFHFDLARMAIQLGLDLTETVNVLGLAEAVA